MAETSVDTSPLSMSLALARLERAKVVAKVMVSRAALSASSSPRRTAKLLKAKGEETRHSSERMQLSKRRSPICRRSLSRNLRKVANQG